MEILSVRYGKTFNIGNYQSEQIAVEANLEEGDVPTTAIKTLKTMVHQIQDIALNDTDKSEEVVDTASATTTSKKKTSKKAASKTSKAAPEVDTDEDTIDDGADEESAKAAAPASKKKTSKKAAAGKKTAKKKTARKTKAATYDRDSSLHKKLVGEMLTEEVPDWKKPKNKLKAGKVSRELAGCDFLDSDGNILDTFREAFVESMNE